MKKHTHTQDAVAEIHAARENSKAPKQFYTAYADFSDLVEFDTSEAKMRLKQKRREVKAKRAAWRED